jgi:hypothetical protein
MQTEETMLVFRRGAWLTVDTTFLAADPGLTEGQRRIGAAVAANAGVRGQPKATAEAVAEQAVYAAAYPGLSYGDSGVARK